MANLQTQSDLSILLINYFLFESVLAICAAQFTLQLVQIAYLPILPLENFFKYSRQLAIQIIHMWYLACNHICIVCVYSSYLANDVVAQKLCNYSSVSKLYFSIDCRFSILEKVSQSSLWLVEVIMLTQEESHQVRNNILSNYIQYEMGCYIILAVGMV